MRSEICLICLLFFPLLPRLQPSTLIYTEGEAFGILNESSVNIDLLVKCTHQSLGVPEYPNSS